MIRPGRRIVLAIAAVILTTAPSRSQSVANVAQNRSPERQKILEAGARREGALMLYTTGTQIQPLIDAFRRLYPFIKVDMPRASSEDVTRKVMEEYGAGVHAVDAYELSSYGLAPMREQGLLESYYSPEQAAYPASAIGPEHMWMSVRESYIGLGYNSKLIAAADAPRTYDDLLSTKWKGRMALSGSDSSAANWVGALIAAKGTDFVRKLGEQNIRVYQITGRALANLTISGEAPIGLTIYSSHVEASKAAGAPIEWVAPGPVPVTDTAAALASEAPHPHAAMLFIDYLLSKDAQLLYRTLGYRSARQDVASPADNGLEKLYLANSPNYVSEFEQWARLAHDVFYGQRR